MSVVVGGAYTDAVVGFILMIVRGGGMDQELGAKKVRVTGTAVSEASSVVH